MIDKNQLEEIMQRHPGFTYELKDVEEGVELNIRKEATSEGGGGYRNIRKVFKYEEEIEILDDIINAHD